MAGSVAQEREFQECCANCDWFCRSPDNDDEHAGFCDADISDYVYPWNHCAQWLGDYRNGFRKYCK